MCIRAGVISSSGLVLCPHTLKVSENQIAGSPVLRATQREAEPGSVAESTLDAHRAALSFYQASRYGEPQPGS